MSTATPLQSGPSTSTPTSSALAPRGSTSASSGRASSPVGYLHRPSTSSVRSKRTEADFEAALKNPQTIFLTGSQAIAEESPSKYSDGGRSRSGDTPEPVEKRSFEEDMKHAAVPTPSKYGPGAGIGGGPAAGHGGSGWMAGLGIGHRDRRESSATQHSGISGSSGGTPSKSFRPKGQAVGLDAEIAAQSPPVQKRRSIFRSAATASSPDLGGLVRKSRKEPSLPPIPSGSKLAKPSPFATSSPHPGVQRVASQLSNGSGSEDGRWNHDRSPSASPNRMATIREGANGYGGHADAHKSMADRAKGMFGRMFGSSSAKSSPISSRRAVSSSANLPTHDPFAASSSLPPPLPKSPVVPASSTDVFGAVSPVSPATAKVRSAVPDSPSTGHTSATPTGPKSPDPNDSPASVLAALPEDKSTGRISGHTREPATTEADTEAPHVPTPQIARTATTFSQDVAGALADIGQESPARELGLAPDDTKSKAAKDPSRAISLETMRVAPQVPLDRERSVSAEVPTDRTKGVTPPAVMERTSSLPKADAQANGSSTRPKRVPPPSDAVPPVSGADFGPIKERDDQDTIRAPSTLSSPKPPSSIRLVTSPKLAPKPWPPAYDDPSAERVDEISPKIAQDEQVEQVDLTEDDDEPETEGDGEVVPSIQTPDGEVEDDEEKGRRLACEFLEENWASVAWDKVAMFLGGPRPVNAIALRYYMQYFDMKGQNLVDAFRDLCAKLHLKAESQEIDRIIEGFSTRYYECNPNTVFGTTGVVHTVTGAMLMLNTDLHIADLTKHMSRADFVRNAMRAIQESMPANDGTSTPDLVRDDSSRFGSIASMGTPTQDLKSKPLPAVPSPHQPPTNRSASAPVVSHTAPNRTPSDASMSFAPALEKARGSTFSVGSATYSKAWEVEAENALRDIFTAVRADKILLPISAMPSARPSNSSLNNLSRSGTIRSPSDRVNALKRASMRGSPFMNSPYGGGFSVSDGRLSPNGSYANSIDETAHLHATLGFASNLSHSVIREHDREHDDDDLESIHSESSTATMDELDDDELALLGAPWAKEGMLQHKLYWEAPGKRAKKGEWKQFFVVVSKGELFMFTFGDSSKGSFTGGKVGGGNWLTNANPVGTIDLMHTYSCTLPKPGLNVDKPHCFSLAAANGQTTIFQAGTADLVQEWITTCNYWAGRRSRQPLAGGVSNMEYGWQRVQGLSGAELLKLEDDHMSVRSGRSNISKLGGGYGKNRAFGPGDRVHINDWKPPIPASLPSPLDEEAQLDSLQVYVKSLDAELDEHRGLEQPMLHQYTQGGKNALKAKENWKARTTYLQTETVKYDTYIEALRSAIAQRVKEQGKRKLEKSLARSNASLHRRDSGDMLGLAVGVDDAGSSPVTPKAKAR